MREHGKNRGAVHYSRFEVKLAAVQLGEFVEFAIGVDDRTFVGADSMSAGFERGFDVLDSGMAVVAIERTGFEKNVGLGNMEPFTDIGGLRRC